ncbi:MAG TPA: A/G-specific adenine glycosylase [Bacteroidia bacterium]|jgi:A/G-specific adenine glycosylase|nr:A/G-specific adenine glycosylase [Bacteroidia bacterium]
MDFFAKKLIKWFKINQRNLPWRGIKDPYKIWLSEIILQQTQVNQGLAYYIKFVKYYPNVKDLANAPVDEVMKHWQGLGYYSRARNLHETAKIITTKHNGVFPKTYIGIHELKGVGDYTAAAIASIAYDLPHAAVDGNVYRVLSRVFDVKLPIDSGEGKKYFQDLANELLPKKEAAIYNQAIMEFGALYCRPVNPDCENCIFNSKCVAFAEQTVSELPFKSKKTKITDRYFNYVLFQYKNNIYISKRSKKDIWQGLYEFYLIESDKKQKPDVLLNSKEFKGIISVKKFVVKSVSHEYKHILSHQNLHTIFYAIQLKQPLKTKLLKKVNMDSIHKYAFPRLIEKYLKDENIIT